jgi:hypothetical protein
VIRLAPWVLLALGLYAAFLVEQQRDDAAIKREQKRWTDSIAVLDAKADGTQTIYVRDTVHATRWRTRYDTLALTDTIVRDSIVYVNKQLADSVIGACSLALNSCGKALQAEQDLTDAWKARALLAETKRKTSWRDRFGLCTGYGVSASPGGAFSHGVQLGVCARVWP